MANTIAVAHEHEIAPHEHHEHISLPQHRHHFETEEQQREAGSFGMWLFLLTEIMFFGGMFFSYLLYRNWYYDAFVPASNQLSIPLGTANTIILITSGFCMAVGCMGGRGAQARGAGLVADPDHRVRRLRSWASRRSSTTRSGISTTFRAPASASRSS